MSDDQYELEGGLVVRVDDGSAPVFRLSGSLDPLSAPAFSAFLQDRIHGATRVVLDLTSVDFVDSAGVRAFLMLAHEVGDDGALVLEGAAPRVTAALRTMGVADLFELRERT